MHLSIPIDYTSSRISLKRGNIFSITAFDVKPNLNCYRLTNNPYKIYFNDHTALEDVNGEQYDIHHEYFRIPPFTELEMMVNKGDHLPDVITKVSCIQTSKKVDETKTLPRTSLNITLTCTFDSREAANISVWEKLAR
ncbi:unnamed protein product [Arabis nemorensis]|uniref:Replication protein A 70 kDa DNA-binding subunit B/D first OB fold domain-containing protein n=1 Tax=Arabis nemorensis TaxID=586526 RepID=A0A565BJA7_9BRAS|nr:unnamed protein product [Arabis nemorensis]